MRRSHYGNGAAKVGFIRTIRADGFNGIADIIPDGVTKMIFGRSVVGVRSADTLCN